MKKLIRGKNVFWAILLAILVLEILIIITAGPFAYSAFLDKPAGISHQELQSFERVYQTADYFVIILTDVLENDKETSYLLSGSLIEVDGEICILTVAHIRGPDEKIINILVYLNNQPRPQEVTLVGYHRKLDIALLKFSDPKFVYTGAVAKLGDSTKVKDGDKVMLLGNTFNSFVEKTIGSVADHWWFILFNDTLLCTGAGTYGYSGGPILNTEGEIIGVTKRGLTNITEDKTTFTIGTKINAVKKVLPELKNGKCIE